MGVYGGENLSESDFVADVGIIEEGEFVSQDTGVEIEADQDSDESTDDGANGVSVVETDQVPSWKRQDRKHIGKAWNIRISMRIRFLTLSYEPGDIEGLDESTLRICHYDAETDTWTELATQTDADTNKVTAEIPDSDTRKRSSEESEWSGIWTISGEPLVPPVVKVPGDLNKDGEADLTDAILAGSVPDLGMEPYLSF